MNNIVGNIFNKICRIIFLISIIISLTTCEKDHMFDCFTSTGSPTTESRGARNVSEIDIDNNVDLIIHQSEEPYIHVTAGKHLIDGIITELNGNTLYIRNENRCNWMRSFKNTYTVEIGMKAITHITVYGSGDISCADTIRVPEFTFDSKNASGTIKLLLDCDKTNINNHTGRTDIHAYGKTGTSIVYINDVGTLDASGMQSVYSYVRNMSTGDIRVNVAHELGALILYNGNIYYTGNPVTINKEISGRGKLIHY